MYIKNKFHISDFIHISKVKLITAQIISFIIINTNKVLVGNYKIDVISQMKKLFLC